MLAFLTSLLAVLPALTHAHSWVECTRYTATITGQDYDPSKCTGYVREWTSYGAQNSLFGVDHGIDHQGGAPNYCSKSLGSAPSYSSSYSAAYPMATYKAGETVRIVWPAKNHANYECMQYIPDTEMKLYANKQVNPSSDPTQIGTSTGNWELVYDWHAAAGGNSGDGIPFQNCPKYCENTDKAVCFGDWTIPANEFPTSGVYSFMWYWVFNPGQAYTACFEANVDTANVVTGDTDFGDSTGGGTGTVASWNIDFPICISGGTYDAAGLAPLGTALSSLLDATTTVVLDGQTSNAFELTASYGATVANGVANNRDGIILAAQAQFGGTATLCSDIHVTAVYDDVTPAPAGGPGGPGPSPPGDSDDAADTCPAVAVMATTMAALRALCL